MRTMFSNLRISTKLFGLVAVLLVSFVGFGTFAGHVLTTVMINGPLYNSIARGHDLIANVIPPTGSVLEAYLIALQMLEEPDRVKLDDMVRRKLRALIATGVFDHPPVVKPLDFDAVLKMAFRRVVLYGAAGRLDEAFECLDQAIAFRDPAMVHVAVAPQWDPLRGDPRFVARLRAMSLPGAA